MSGGFTKGDDVYTCGALGVHNGNRQPTDKTERQEPLLSVREAVVLKRECWSIKHPRRVNKVETVIFEVAKALLFVPGKPNDRTVYTLLIGVNRPWCLALDRMALHD